MKPIATSSAATFENSEGKRYGYTENGSSISGTPTRIMSKGKQTDSKLKAGSKKNGKQLDVMQAIFGECLCTDAVTFMTSSSKYPAAQFVLLDGIECIALGAVVDEQTPRERVKRTVAQLITSTERLISVGYLRDGSPASNLANEEEGAQGKLLIEFNKITEVLPIKAWQSRNTEASNKRGRYTEFVFPLAIGSVVDHLKRNEFDLALEVFDEMLQDHREKRNEDDAMLEGLTIHNIGVIHMLSGNFTLAFPAFREAVRVKQAAFGVNHPEVAVSLVEAGIQFFANEQFEEALVVLNDALKVRVQAYGANSPKVAMVLNNIGCVHFEMGNRLAALGTFQEAYDIQQLALGSSQKADLDLLHFATILSNIGYIKLQVKNYDDARTVLEEAMLVQQSVLGDDHKYIKDTISNMEFANAFHS